MNFVEVSHPMRNILAASISLLSLALTTFPRAVHAESIMSARKMTGSAAGLPPIDMGNLVGTYMVPVKGGKVAGPAFPAEELWNNDETVIIFVVRRPG